MMMMYFVERHYPLINPLRDMNSLCSSLLFPPCIPHKFLCLHILLILGLRLVGVGRTLSIYMYISTRPTKEALSFRYLMLLLFFF